MLWLSRARGKHELLKLEGPTGVGEAEARTAVVERACRRVRGPRRDARRQKRRRADNGQVGWKMQAGAADEIVGLGEMEAAEMSEGTRGRRTRG